jgi:hypothetical protein
MSKKVTGFLKIRKGIKMSEASISPEDYEQVFGEDSPEDYERETEEAFWRAIEKDD